MPELDLRDPWFLLAAGAAPVIYVLLTRRVPSAVVYSTLALLDGTPRSLRSRLANLPPLLLAGAAVAMAVALAGPRTPDAESRVRREGIAIMMVVDRSSSMDGRDLVPEDVKVNRLAVVKSVFRAFVLGEGDGAIAGRSVAGRPDDVIGLIAFARYADALCPLTLDHGSLASILADMTIVSDGAEDGTALGEGLALAVERLRQHPARSKVAILLTDGVNNAGNITPEQAAELAAAHDVKLYAIGAGTRGQAPMPWRDSFTGRLGLRAMRVDIDEQVLRAMADRTGGRYFRATDAEGLADIYGRIDALERTEISELRYMQYHEWYGVCVLTALALMASGALLAGTFLRRLP